MRAVVTGGAGFIGSTLVDRLQAEGCETLVIDDLSTGRRENLAQALAAGARLFELDVLDAKGVDDAFGAHRPEIVFHLAAQIDVRRSMAAPAADARVNVEGTVNVLEAARRAGARRLVFASTGGAIYGDTDRLPTDESATPRPQSPYGQAKLAAEGYCRLYSEELGLPAVALRFSNVYGPRQDPLGEGGVVAIFCHALRERRAPMVFGDGHQTRDFLYVDDAVAALWSAAAARSTEAINISTGRESSVLDLLEQLGAIAGGAPAPRFEPPRAGEIARSCLDPSLAARLIRWSAHVGFAEGLRRTAH